MRGDRQFEWKPLEKSRPRLGHYIVETAGMCIELKQALYRLSLDYKNKIPKSWTVNQIDVSKTPITLPAQSLAQPSQICRKHIVQKIMTGTPIYNAAQHREGRESIRNATRESFKFPHKSSPHISIDHTTNAKGRNDATDSGEAGHSPRFSNHLPSLSHRRRPIPIVEVQTEQM